MKKKTFADDRYSSVILLVGTHTTAVVIIWIRQNFFCYRSQRLLHSNLRILYTQLRQ